MPLRPEDQFGVHPGRSLSGTDSTMAPWGPTLLLANRQPFSAELGLHLFILYLRTMTKAGIVEESLPVVLCHRRDSVLASNSSRRLGTVWGAHARTRSSGAPRASKRSVRLTCRCGVCGLPQQMGASETFWDDRMEITLAFLHNFSMRQSLDPLRCLSSVLLA